MNTNRKTGTALLLSALATSLMVGTAFAQTAAASADWPPALKPLPDFYGYLTPEESLKTFTLPPGFGIELVASEPLIGDAIAMQWDYDGRLWVVETTFMQNLDTLTSATPGSTIAILEDTDNDGVMDTRKVFADGLILPRSLLVLEPGKVLVGEPPNIQLFEDTDGDDVVDKKTILDDGYGALGGSIEHNPNGMFWNIDNRIYNAYLDKVYTWNGTGFDTVAGKSESQWGVTADDEGRIMRQGNSAAPSMNYVSDQYYSRNSLFTRKRGNHEWIGGPTRDANKVWPARPTPGINRAYQQGVLAANGALDELTSAGGLDVYRGDALPDWVYGDVFLPEPAANLVTRSTLQDTGSGIFLKKAYEKADFLTSTEERFRPVFVENGPDGSLYVLDLYHGIIQDAVFLTNYLKSWVDQNDLGDTHGANGRIYRITHEDGQKGEIVKLSEASPEQLVGYLEHANGWYRDNAQRLLVVQQQKDAVPALLALVNSDKDAVARLHALWTLDGLHAVEPELVIAALNDTERSIRVAALRIAEQWLGEAGSPVADAFIKVIGNTNNDWNVQYQLAASAGFLGDENRLATILKIIETYGKDYIVIDAALSGLRDDDVNAFLDLLLASTSESVAVKNALTTVVGAIVSTGTAEDVASLLDTIGSPDLPAWQRDAALVGTEVVLAGASDPGNAPALPRAQLGPRAVDKLGDTHFADYRDRVNAADEAAGEAAAAEVAAEQTAPSNAALVDVEGVPTLQLAAAPTAFLALGETAELTDRIAAVAGLIVWPDKPAE